MEQENRGLIYDIGLHKGEDTAFYLKKGFNVIGIEANPELCKSVAQNLSSEIESGSLTLLNQAIANERGDIDFYINEKLSVWGTASIDWVQRNDNRGAKSHCIQVPATRLTEILNDYGCPYYLKVDIEGFDHLCLEHLLELEMRPDFVSVESSATSLRDTLYQLELLEKLGYRRFKIIPQKRIFEQKPPIPALEGEGIEYCFEAGSSGLFGKELPGKWMDIKETKIRYRRLHFECRMIGNNNGIFRNTPKIVKSALLRFFPNGLDWFDTHATF